MTTPTKLPEVFNSFTNEQKLIVLDVADLVCAAEMAIAKKYGDLGPKMGEDFSQKVLIAFRENDHVTILDTFSKWHHDEEVRHILALVETHFRAFHKR